MNPRLILLAVPFFCVSMLFSQGRTPTVPRKPAEVGASATSTQSFTLSELIKVTIYPSRNEVVPTGSYGVYADLENISGFPVMILPSQTALVVLPEAAQPSACVNWEPAIFPTESSAEADRAKGPDLSAKGHWDNPLLIEPGEHYLVFWDLEPPSKKHPRSYRGRCELPPDWYSVFGFVPGDYVFTVEGNAYALQPPASASTNTANSPGAPGNVVSPATQAVKAGPAAASASTLGSQLSDLLNRARAGAVPAHRFSETKTLHVGLSQVETLAAAMSGAFIAYWVIALRPDKDWDAFFALAFEDRELGKEKPEKPITVTRKWFAGFSLIRNAVLAAVLGGVVTIVASRLSDTHFPVKVSVNDWWGALTIGFIAYFLGNKFIDKLSSLGGGEVSNLGKTPGTPAPEVQKKDDKAQGAEVFGANDAFGG
jgi:hypothetical protein